MTSYERLPRRYVLFGGQRVAYVVAGSGPTLLLLHGLGGTADFWQPVVERLSGSFRLIVPDLLGFGFSDKPRLGYTLARHCGALLAVLRAAGVAQLHALVSHSVGGVLAVALQASGLAPAERLALAASAYPSPRFPVRQELVPQPFFNLLLNNRRVARIDNAFWQSIWPLLRRRQVPAYLRGGWAGFMDYTADSFYDTAEQLLFCTNLDPLLARMRDRELLLLHSKADSTVPFVHAERLHAALPRSTLLTPAGGHYAVINEGLPMLEEWLIPNVERKP